MSRSPNKQHGFTLIEVLISMVILAIGLLGFAAMQAMSLRDNQDAYYYQQSTLLASEMQDRIRGNNFADWSAVTIGTGDCTKDSPCDAQTMANNDYGYWKKSAENILSKPKTGETVEISHTAQVNTNCNIITINEVCLITRWARTHSQSSDTSSKLSDTATFYLKVTP
ncbi:MAG: type IV pilus modification protein PilV [Methylococcales bacterium]|jgi:type IV pilus assembly protein PilV|nr:type IV pilus modification protein PilV [Methylococcales bacterium]